MRVRRPKTKTKTCAHCKRRRPRLTIEWHPGIEEWQCSDFGPCDKAIARNEARVHERVVQATDKEFWKRMRRLGLSGKIVKSFSGKKLDMTNPEDRKWAPGWMDIFRQKQLEARKAA